MRSVIAGCLIAVVLSLASMPARAYITLDAIVPESPVAGEMVSVQISDGVCDAIVESEGYPQITQSGNVIRILLETIHYDDPMLCHIEPATGTIAFGTFPPGTYTLQVDRRYGYISSVVTEAVGTESFVVRSDVAVAIPTLSLVNLFLLALGVLAAAGVAFKRRRG